MQHLASPANTTYPSRMKHLVFFLAACVAAAPAAAAGPHSHGTANLDVAVSGGEVTLMLRSPLENFVGFERAPRNEKETAAVRAAAAALREGSVFAFPAAAGCALTQVRLASDVLPAPLLGETDGAKPGAAKRSSEHADLDGEFSYRCANAAALDAFEVPLFDHFKRFRRIDVQVAGTNKQSAIKLTPRTRRVPLR